MEALETAISYWYEVLEAYQQQSRAGGALAIPTAEEAEFTAHLQELLDDAYRLQDQGDQLFHDERSILFKADGSARGAGSVAASLSEYRTNTNNSGVMSTPESFVSAQDEVADLRDLDEFQDTFPGLDTLPLYKDALKKLEEEGIPYRCLRTEMVNCNSDTEYLSKLHCVRLAFQYLFLDHTTWQWCADAGRQVLVDLLLFADKDPKDFLVAYEEMLEFLQELKHWEDVEKELSLKGVKAMTFFDVVMDYILMDAFDDLDNPPSSVTAVIQNRWLSNGFKETALATAVWSVLKAKRRMLKYPYGFMAHFYSISEHMSPLMAWGFLGPDEKLREVCYYFRDQVMSLLQDIFSFQKSRYTVVGELASDIFTHLKTRVDNITFPARTASVSQTCQGLEVLLSNTRTLALSCQHSDVDNASSSNIKIQEGKSKEVNHNFKSNTKVLKVALIGRPNAGKSTLINQIVGRTSNPVSMKAHTTRAKVKSFTNEGDTQIVFLDTPGLVSPEEVRKYKFDPIFLRGVEEAICEADVMGVLHDASFTNSNTIDPLIARLLLLYRQKRSFLLLNKVDAIKKKYTILKIVQSLTKNLKVPAVDSRKLTEQEVMEHAQKVTSWPHFREIFMVSGLTGDGVGDVKEYLLRQAIPGPWLVKSKDQIINPQELAIDFVKAACLDYLKDEVPYRLEYKLNYFEDYEEKCAVEVGVIPLNSRHQRMVMNNVRPIAAYAEANLASALEKECRLRISVQLKEEE
ncbi:hypothetical protein ONE63_004090 [Megalurothrips usitatus]|uniref:Era-type G domain-containing protein n=1 Tax=Megalurothrips usitatus TaxID=439358 RepID=A0AAV7X896_9NEOP|nr:hypothetical protein ONE63_004090 [Megalurothrips usitatus]